jgi:phosphoserine phosphatase
MLLISENFSQNDEKLSQKLSKLLLKLREAEQRVIICSASFVEPAGFEPALLLT